MTPKKKLWTIIVAVVVFAALAVGAFALQNSLVNSEDSSGSALTPVAVPLESSASSSGESSGETTVASAGPSGSLSSSGLSSSSTSSQNHSGASVLLQSSSSSSSQSASTPQKTVLVYIYNGVEGEYLLKTTSANGGVVKDITVNVHKEHGLKYALNSSGSYFEMLAGIRERATGAESGWIFFYKRESENSFTRSNISAKGIALQPGDSLLWLYAEAPLQYTFPEDLK